LDLARRNGLRSHPAHVGHRAALPSGRDRAAQTWDAWRVARHSRAGASIGLA